MTQVPQPIRIPLAVLAAVLVSATACSDTPTDSDFTDVSAVLAMGNGGGGKPPPSMFPINMIVTMPESLTGGASNALWDDRADRMTNTEERPYQGGECSVTSDIDKLGEGTSTLSDLRYSIRLPQADNLKGKALREALTCEDFARTFTINITTATMVHFGPRGDAHNLLRDRPLSELILDEAWNAVNPDRLIDRPGLRSLAAWLPNSGDDVSQRASFNTPYCLSPNKGGPPLIFTTSRAADSDDLLVTYEDVNGDGIVSGEIEGFTVSTKPFPNNVGHCTSHDVFGDPLELLLHLDLSYTVRSIP